MFGFASSNAATASLSASSSAVVEEWPINVIVTGSSWATTLPTALTIRSKRTANTNRALLISNPSNKSFRYPIDSTFPRHQSLGGAYRVRHGQVPFLALVVHT